MLTHVNIQNFAIIENLDLEIRSGMTVITGETGAGKSIVIDALDIALGDRADSKLIRHGAQRCAINLNFDIQSIPDAKTWLQDKELQADNECIIRRTFSRDGRSRHTINGHAVTLQQLRELGHLLVHVHGQHQHQALLKREEQLQLLDNYANHPALLKPVKSLYQQWRELQKQRELFSANGDNHAAKLQLLRYQVDELEQLNLEPNEVEALHQEQKQLATAESVLQASYAANDSLSENPEQSILQLLSTVQQQLLPLTKTHQQLANICELLNNAIIQCQEAHSELNDFIGQVEINPERLQWVEQRLADIHSMARKHKVHVDELPHHQQALHEQWQQLTAQSETLQQLDQQERALLTDYAAAAKQLTHSRQHAAQQLNQLISASMQQLGMPGGQFQITIEALNSEQPQARGLDRVEFLVTANPGQPLQALSKVASGGELSRISLAIQVITAQADSTPTLVFDEVDVGIGGATAEIVGKLLRQLGQTAQVICITHLPQVAAQGHHHLRINKQTESQQTHSLIQCLSHAERIQEIARMVGGVHMTEQSLAHAQAMLEA